MAAASAFALVLGQAISLAQTIAVARLLSPSVVGVFVAGTVITSFLANLVEGGIRSALIQRDHDLEDAAETVFYATLATGILLSLGTLASAPIIGLVFHSHTAALVAAATSGILLIYSLVNVPEAFLQREFSIARRIIVGPLIALSNAVVAVTGAALGWGVWALVAGMYASFVSWVIGVWWISDWRPGRGRPSFRLWREMARYGFPLVLGFVGTRIHDIFESVTIGRWLGSAALGTYRYSQRVAQIPVMAIIEIGAVALFPVFSRIADNTDRFRTAYLNGIRFGVVGAAPMSGLMFALGQPSVTVVFGEPWRAAGSTVMAMAGVGVGKALICVSEEAIKASGRTRLLNWITLTEVVSGVGFLLLLIGPYGLVGAGLAISLAATCIAVVSVWLARPVVGVRLRDVATAAFPPLPGMVAATAACWALEHLVFHSDERAIPVAIALLLVDVAVFGVIYLAGLSLVSRDLVAELFGLVRRKLARS
ncbi:polysaccharide biosynthesis protein [Nocardiaceae bacterium YC2-7]|uniref:Polysaccharide biosynthesis protein n=2 Tax=Antrihabitans stalactiti TaxID=2584121 RepID=A0A848KHY0_9NOCA|nr:polysaccharide biosynthesis protein [Antrihabitans stalactiti]